MFAPQLSASSFLIILQLLSSVVNIVVHFSASDYVSVLAKYRFNIINYNSDQVNTSDVILINTMELLERIVAGFQLPFNYLALALYAGVIAAFMNLLALYAGVMVAFMNVLALYAGVMVPFMNLVALYASVMVPFMNVLALYAGVIVAFMNVLALYAGVMVVYGIYWLCTQA